jgi:hypothetical protein
VKRRSRREKRKGNGRNRAAEERGVQELERILIKECSKENLKIRNQQTKIVAFWDVTPYSLVEMYRRFRGTCCLHRHSSVMKS